MSRSKESNPYELFCEQRRALVRRKVEALRLKQLHDALIDSLPAAPKAIRRPSKPKSPQKPLDRTRLHRVVNRGVNYAEQVVESPAKRRRRTLGTMQDLETQR